MSKTLAFAPATRKSPEIVAEMLLAISEGGTVSGLWADDPVKYPHPVTWSDWLAADPALSLACARARQHAAEFHVAAAQTIISTEPERVYTKEGSRYDSAHVTWLKNRSDFHMKRAAQIKPDEYGDKTLHAGHDGGALKAEMAVSLPQLAERLREAKRASVEGQTVEHQARRPEPSTAALLADDKAQPAPAFDRAPRRTMEQHGAAEPGDDGMEFV